MPILSNNNENIIKIMDNSGNVILDASRYNYETVTQQPPITFTSETNTLKDYVIYGNTGGVGVQINLFDKSNADVVSLYPSNIEEHLGEVVESDGTNIFARSILFAVDANTTYTFSVKKSANEHITNRLRVAGYAQSPSEGDQCTFLQSNPVRVGDYMTNTFTTTSTTQYVLVLLWVEDDQDDVTYTDEYIEQIIATRELQLEKGAYPTDYAPYGDYRIPVVVIGKNIFNKDDAEVVNYWIKSTDSSWYSVSNARTVVMPCDPNTQYTLSKSATNRLKVATFANAPQANDIAVDSFAADNDATSCTFKTGATVHCLALLIAYGDSYDETISSIVASIQLEEGSSATTFESYSEKCTSIPIPFALTAGKYTNYATSEKPIAVNVGYNRLLVRSTVQPEKVKVLGRIKNRTSDFDLNTEIARYKVYFYNGDTLLQTVDNISYGGTATYTGETPELTNGNFTGWSPLPSNITTHTSCYAQFESTVPGLIIDSWQTISQRSAAGTAQNYYSVGDCKAVELNGTMGTLSLDHLTLYVYILGFDHNSELEGTGVTFGGFKTSVGDSGIDVALSDGHETMGNNASARMGTKYFNMHHWGQQYGNNYGGWKGCDLRYDILGSTDVSPTDYGSYPTSARIGYDATSNCATNPVANTLMSCLPMDLRIVMNHIMKYTYNTGGRSNIQADVTVSIDYLPLLSEYEVFGWHYKANQYEKDFQTQYAYYAVGNSKVKYRHYQYETKTTEWWLRSPFTNDNGFIYVTASGDEVVAHSNLDRSIAPVFLI